MNNLEGSSPNETTTSEKKPKRSRKTGEFGRQVIGSSIEADQLASPKSSKFSEWFKSKKPNQDDIELAPATPSDVDSAKEAEKPKSNETAVQSPEELSAAEMSTIAALAHEHSQLEHDNDPAEVKDAINEFYQPVINEGVSPEVSAVETAKKFFKPLSPHENRSHEESSPTAEAPTRELAEDNEYVVFDRNAEEYNRDEPYSDEVPPAMDDQAAYETYVRNAAEAEPANDGPVATPHEQGPAAPRSRERTTDFTAGLVGGGIMSYLMGKRAGRIQTEAKFQPVKRKLERQVKSYSERLKKSEEVVRVEARKIQAMESHANSAPESRPSKPVQKEVKQEKNLKFEKLVKKTLKIETKPAEVTKTTERIAKAIVPVETILPAKEVAAEIPTPQATKEKPRQVKENVRVETKEVPLMPEQIDKLNRRELMEVSKKIVVEGRNLKEIYDKHLLGEKGLRRLVKEYLRGGNIERALKRELIERQIDFERDPVLRDRNSQEGSSSSSATNASDDSLKSMIDQAANKLPANAPSLETYEEKSQPSSSNLASTTDIAIVATIVLLLAAIVIIYLSKH